MEKYKSDEKFKQSIRDIKKINNQMTLKKNKSTLISANADRKKRSVKKILQDFTESSSIHGVKYLGMQSIVKSCIGKLLWLIVVVAGFFGANIMLNKFLVNLENNPTELRVETFYSPIINAPFPAITICPSTPTMLKTQLDLMKNIKLPANMSNEEAMFFIKYGTDITTPHITRHPNRLNKYVELLKVNKWTLIDFLAAIKPCKDMIESCWWQGLQINCTDYIKQSYTYYGICCSYNYYLEYLMKYDVRFQEVPILHSVKTGSKSGLTIIFNRDLFFQENETESTNFVNSVKLLVFVHHTVSYPSAETVGYSLQKGQELKLRVQPIIKKKPQNIYHTYFNDSLQLECIPNTQKSNLRFFNEYHQSNCFVDCTITEIYKMCGCVRYIYAPMANYTSLRICDSKDVKCLNKYWYKIKSVNFDTCFCSSLCEDTIYKISTSKYYLKNTQLSVSPIYQHLTATHTVLKVFWKMDFFMIFDTQPASINWKNLAEVGGIFSLFLGCSILSAVEIIYFIYLLCRGICSKKQTHNN
ncbi:PREDICTED: sodium channel protein Nach-like [Polistes dominula]|uniref:Sodium channel protein Nach-like n=1 Tax=Polistes dominula TaxID=743375 RepID=A0ABM1IRR9_POLDO|nr:PREDICTED: sodium channel protein Nach-like [Polistes dominula]